MPRQTRRGGDVTGRNAEILAEQHREEQEIRAGEMTLLTAAKAQVAAEPVNLVPDSPAAPVILSEDGSFEEVQDIVVQDPIVEFYVNEELEDVTIGQGNLYNFREGTPYRAPAWVRDHLEEKGYVRH